MGGCTRDDYTVTGKGARGTGRPEREGGAAKSSWGQGRRSGRGPSVCILKDELALARQEKTFRNRYKQNLRFGWEWQSSCKASKSPTWAEALVCMLRGRDPRPRPVSRPGVAHLHPCGGGGVLFAGGGAWCTQFLGLYHFWGLLRWSRC